MKKTFTTAVLATLCVTTALGFSSDRTLAGTCASNCPKVIQFVPGQRITFEVANYTQSLVQMQSVNATDPIAVSPGQITYFPLGGNTLDNLSVVLWDATGLPIRVQARQTSPRTLRIEVRPGGRPPGDRTIYLRDDGRVAIY